MTQAKSRDAIRQFDRHAIEDLGIPGVVLMENAGRQIAAAARDMIQGAADPKVVILAGRGNNGGDGFVVGRHLAMDASSSTPSWAPARAAKSDSPMPT